MLRSNIQIYRYILLASIICIINNTILSQIAVNEIIFANDSLLKIELYNNSNTAGIMQSISLMSDSTEIRHEYQDFQILPSEFIVLDLKLLKKVCELRNISIMLNNDEPQLTTVFKGCIMTGESAGRYPDFYGDFIIYDPSRTSPGGRNIVPGILVKKSSRAQFSPRDSSPNATLLYNNLYWIFGGWEYHPESGTYSSRANIWNSADGLNWTLVNDDPPFSPYSAFIVFNNKMMVYSADTVFISSDGMNWDRHFCNTFTYENYRFTEFRNKLYVISFDRMYESADGINWTMKQTDFPREEFRYLPALVSSGHRLWLYGGMLGHNDVWTSDDGLHWNRLLEHAPWSPRIWFNYTYFDNKIWMIAGNDQNVMDTINFGNQQDFWYSADGVNWNLLETDTAFQHRHASLLWNDGKKVLISSGFGNNYVERLYNDIWELDAAITLNSSQYLSEQTVCVNLPVQDVEYAIKGGEGVKVTGMPEGIEASFSNGICTISGIPETSGVFNYEIAVESPYKLPYLTGSLTIYPETKLTLISDNFTTEQSLLVNKPLTVIKYEVKDADNVLISGLPSGLSAFSYENEYIITGSPAETGLFNYYVNTSGKCFSLSATGIIHVSANRVYPNPTHGLIYITDLSDFTLRIFNISGQKIFEKIYHSDYSVSGVDFSSVLKENGMYLFNIRDNVSGNTYTEKIIFVQ